MNPKEIITRRAAKLFKDGDVVIWTADPMKTLGAESYTTIVDGKIVYQA